MASNTSVTIRLQSDGTKGDNIPPRITALLAQLEIDGHRVVNSEVRVARIPDRALPPERVPNPPPLAPPAAIVEAPAAAPVESAPPAGDGKVVEFVAAPSAPDGPPGLPAPDS